MDEQPSRVDTLMELETRQDEVLRGLDELNAKLEKLLAEFKPSESARVIPMPSLEKSNEARAA